MVASIAAASSLRFATVFFASICWGETPRPSGPPRFGQEIHRPHSRWPLDYRYADGVSPPGLSKLDVLISDDDSTLLGYSPWRICRSNAQLADVFLWLREFQQLDPVWEKAGNTYGYWFEFVEKWRDEKTVPQAARTSSVGKQDHLGFSLKLGNLGLKYSDERRRGGGTIREPRAREYTQLVVIDGKGQRFRFYEGATEFVYQQDAGLLEVTYGKPPRVIRSEQNEENRARVVVRWSPETSWYYVRVFMSNRSAGPGWRLAPKERNSGEIRCLPHWTDMDEQIVIRWSRSDV